MIGVKRFHQAVCPRIFLLGFPDVSLVGNQPGKQIRLTAKLRNRLPVLRLLRLFRRHDVNQRGDDHDILFCADRHSRRRMRPPERERIEAGVAGEKFQSVFRRGGIGQACSTMKHDLADQRNERFAVHQEQTRKTVDLDLVFRRRQFHQFRLEFFRIVPVRHSGCNRISPACKPGNIKRSIRFPIFNGNRSFLSVQTHFRPDSFSKFRLRIRTEAKFEFRFCFRRVIRTPRQEIGRQFAVLRLLIPDLLGNGDIRDKIHIFHPGKNPETVRHMKISAGIRPLGILLEPGNFLAADVEPPVLRIHIFRREIEKRNCNLHLPAVRMTARLRLPVRSPEQEYSRTAVLSFPAV